MEFYIAGITIAYLFGSCDLDLDPMTHTERHRDTTKIIYHATLRLVKNL